MSIPLPRIRREELPAGKSLCEYCTAKCCRYFALPIETPTERSDYDYLRWYLLHEGATLFTEDDTWFLLVYAKCNHLLDDGRCGIYETRPKICRAYSTKNCEYDDQYTYERYFEIPEQVEEYMEAIFPPKNAKRIRSPKPALLPVLG